MDFEIKLDSTTTIYMSPSFAKSEIKKKTLVLMLLLTKLEPL